MEYNLPLADENGWVKTLNDKGYMATHFDPFTEEFLELCKENPGLSIFEGGTAYGNAALAAMENGAYVTANDSEEKHLKVLEQRASSYQDKLTLLPGTLPYDVDCSSSSFDAILCSRMLHFLNGEELENCMHNFYKWLKPGGKAYLIAETPYLKCYSDFIPFYEDRKKRNSPWPGLLENSASFSTIRYNNIPMLLHFLDPEIFSDVCLSAGFRVEKCQFIDRHDFPPELRFDGRESVGIIVTKP